VISFANHFNLGKTQPELAFVNVPINADIPLFIDPFAISQRTDRWSQDCHSILVEFFSRVIHEIRSGNASAARELLLHLREPNGSMKRGWMRSLIIECSFLIMTNKLD
jgi:hypothetical protein